MAFDELYDTNVLIGVTENLFKASNWLLDRYFTRVVQSDTQYISIDIDLGLRRLAPFSLPTNEAPLVEGRRISTQSYTPSYIKDKRALDIYKPVRRMIGERIGGENNAAARAAANIQFEMADQEDMIKRREEVMAAQGLVAGSLTISGPDVPTQFLDFGRQSDLSPAPHTGTALWDDANTVADPCSEIENAATLVLKRSGAYPTDLIVTPSVWKALRRNTAFKDAFYLPRGTMGPGEGYRSGNSLGEFGAMGGEGGIYVGRWGTLNIYLYNSWYLDTANVEQRIIPDGVYILTSPSLEGYRAYGAIIDGDAGYRAMPRFPKSWVSNDPAQRFLMMQSAPLVFPGRVNAAFVQTVTSANSLI